MVELMRLPEKKVRPKFGPLQDVMERASLAAVLNPIPNKKSGDPTTVNLQWDSDPGSSRLANDPVSLAAATSSPASNWTLEKVKVADKKAQDQDIHEHDDGDK